MTVESRAKMSLAQMGNKHLLGHFPSEETKAKMSAAKMGHIVSPEQRAKQSAAEKGHVAWGPKHQTPETRAKISVANKGHKMSLEGRTKLSTFHTGLKQSPETRAKISAAGKGRIVSPETRAKKSVAQWKGGRKVGWARAHAKRKGLGYVFLNERFAGCEGHHVDNDQVIHVPKALHRSIYHNQHTGKGMAQINAIAYNYLFKQEVEAAMEAVHGCN
jgi:hypothetical protein